MSNSYDTARNIYMNMDMISEAAAYEQKWQHHQLKFRGQKIKWEVLKDRNKMSSDDDWGTKN